MHKRRAFGLLFFLLGLVVPSSAMEDAVFQPVPLISRSMRDADVRVGGEGAQWPQAVAVDGQDGRFMLFGTDVGGLFRSLDGGASWEPANVGYTPRGTSCLAIDPRNARRCIAVGTNSGSLPQHGIYLSEDQAAAWRIVLPVNICGMRDMRGQLTYAPASFDPVLGFTTDVYWSRVSQDRPQWGKVDPDPAIYKSVDGGANWLRLPGTEAYAGGEIRAHPTQRDTIYVTCANGLFISRDGGGTFERLLEGAFTGLAVSSAAPDGLWTQRQDAILHSSDYGSTWTELPFEKTTGFILRRLNVSPVDPKMIVTALEEKGGYNHRRFVSRDGGATWLESSCDNSGAFLPYNGRQLLNALHPANPKIVLSIGGDWPTLSTDGGKTYRWAGEGVNGVLVGGKFDFNVTDPNVLFVGSQDYNGALTIDGGHIWHYTNASGRRWGGFTYGGYAISRDRLIVGNAGSWGGDRVLRVSNDGGASWKEFESVRWSKKPASADYGEDSAMGDPADPATAFVAGFRTRDAGDTWERMVGCNGVLTASSAAPHRLFGVERQPDDQARIVFSDDHGASWQVLCAVRNPVRDLAWDPVCERLYVAAQHRLLVLEKDGLEREVQIPADQFGRHRITGVAVDPVDPAVVYVAQHQNGYSAENAISRSTDAGSSWTVLTRRKPLDGVHRDGGREAMTVRVHPVTREAWITTSCYGIWKVLPPVNK